MKLARSASPTRRSVFRSSVLLLLLLPLLSVPSYADVLTVPGDYGTIQAAINASVDGDEIVVSPGTYVENINFGGKNIALRSTAPTDPDVVASTIIDGSQAGSVVTFSGAESPDCVLSGFTITNGYAEDGGGICGNGTLATIRDNVISANEASSNGGGLHDCYGSIQGNTISANEAAGDGGGAYIEEGTPTVTDCTFSDNSASGDGGGLYNRVYWDSERIPVTYCTFSANTAGGDGGGMCKGEASDCTFVGNTAGYGGALYKGSAVRCTFSGNSASLGGGIYDPASSVTDCTFVDNAAGSGAGVKFGERSSDVVNCRFIDNVAVNYGGGIGMSHYSSPSVYNCLFEGNEATYGGAISDDTMRSSVSVVACTFFANIASEKGGAVHNPSWLRVNPEYENCLFVSNRAPEGGGLYAGGRDPTVRNCTFTGNTGRAIFGDATVISCILWGDPDGEFRGSDNVTYSNVQGGHDGVGNISTNPLFVDPAGGDFRLQASSPCIDAGTSVEASETDIMGLPRLLGSSVDMGAYEFNDQDTDGDGILDTYEGSFDPDGDETPNYLDLDSDGDGLDDAEEAATYGTDPYGTDSDGDGLPDGWEADAGLDPAEEDTDANGTPDGEEDLDADGLDNAGEYQHDTDAVDSDTDGDGLSDGQEVNVHRTDPLETDTDGDGLTDGDEVNIHLSDPRDTDTDDDGLADGAEINTYSTDPLDPDTDGDGVPDGWEVDMDLDPLDDDTDDNGTPDGEEDPDDDGLTNAGEYQHGTDPLDPDTDGDGVPDGDEVAAGTDPNVDDRPEITVPGDYPTIQAAIDAATNGTEIVVSRGTYTENINFRGKNVILRSTDPGDPDVVADTIIDGTQAASVVVFRGDESSDCILSGFTITNGYAPDGGGIHGNGALATIGSNLISGNSTGSYGNGGGLHDCDGTIHDNTISGNSAGQDGGGLHDCDGTIHDNTISGNSAGQDGGGLYDCDGEIHNNTISDNIADDDGGGLYDCHGTIHNNTVSDNIADDDGGGFFDCDATIRNNTISGNFADSHGGGLYRCYGTIENNIISANSAGAGGGLYDCNGTIRNNVISDNWLDSEYGDGGGLYDCDGAIENNTIFGNTAGLEGGWYWDQWFGGEGGGLYGCGGAIVNCIMWGNTAARSGQLRNCTTPSYSCIQDWTEGGEGNISSDPQFSAGRANFHLVSSSPCIDAGGYVEGLSDDFEGDARGYDGTSEPRGDGCDYDIGADEYVPSTADSDADGLVDAVETDTGVYVDQTDTGTDPNNPDTDGDGMPDGWEVGNSLNPLADDSSLDADGDGLSNLDEHLRGTDPLVADTDGDGYTDGIEVAQGYDPLDPTSHPVPIPPPTTPQPRAGGRGGAGGPSCFIATAAYGTPLAGEVGILSDFRDTYLLTNRVGTAFVRTYYRFSPPLARFIAEHKALRAAVRAVLTPIVAIAKLNVTFPLSVAALLAGVAVALSRLRRRRFPSERTV